MFEKLLAVLPYNPSLVHQLSFYGQRMRQEQMVRRLGLILIVLTFMVQFFAVISPPKSTVASSNNDILNGGFSSKQEAIDACNSNRQNYQQILSYYGISCGDVSNSQQQTLYSTDADRQLLSLGRLPYGQTNPNSGKPTGETPQNIPGVGTVYSTYLWSFDTIPRSEYQVLAGRTSTGKIFYLMFRCGNLVFIGQPAPADVCANLDGVQTSADQCDVCPNRPGTQSTNNECDVCDTVPGVQTSANECDVCPKVNGVQTRSDQCDVCANIPGIQSDISECKPCDKAVSSADSLACISVSKTGANLTQNISDANNTTAQPNDTIVYTLYAKNNGKALIKDYIFQENISDVLDYADVIDFHGGIKDINNTVVWPKADIKAGETASVKITVRVKAVIPETPVSASDNNHFDLIMTNVYGNTVNIKVPKPPVKTVETVAATLPQTGPGTTMFFGVAVVMIAGYFFARARLLSNEVTIAIQETTNGDI